MRGWALLLLLTMAGAVPLQPAAAQDASPPLASGLPPGVTAADRAAIQDVIRHQLEAFQRDDAAGAYAAAAPPIRRLFPTADGFMAMVKRAYPPVYRPLSSEFSELALREGDLVQEVELVGPDGKPVLAVYTMQRGPDGAWLISGCSLIPSARLAV